MQRVPQRGELLQALAHQGEGPIDPSDGLRPLIVVLVVDEGETKALPVHRPRSSAERSETIGLSAIVAISSISSSFGTATASPQILIVSALCALAASRMLLKKPRCLVL